jgi:hypothetical protein
MEQRTVHSGQNLGPSTGSTPNPTSLMSHHSSAKPHSI